tara:strand:+ start:4441 stop:5379 length:939 start_codon:yes stop_codon:yes gene_type:complete
MALPTSTLHTGIQIGRREDLSDVIYDISPTDTPFMSGIGRKKATGILHEWQTDTLATAAQNAVIEGDEATTDAATVTVRLSNSCQISDKVPRITGTSEAVDKAGRKSEMAYQVSKRARELKRDMEVALTRNGAETTGDTATARTTAGLGAWMDTNTSAGTGGSDGSVGNTARTDGTQRAFTETLLKGVIESCWTAGGDPDCLMVGAFNKQEASTFTGNATRFKGAEDSELVAAIDVYNSDFGEFQIIANRFSRSRDAWLLQKDLWAVAYLRSFQLQDLSRTGDSERKQLIVEYSLESRNEAGSGLIADLTTS